MSFVFDFPSILDYITNLDGWVEVEEKSGFNYHYKTKDGYHEAVINVEQSEHMWLEIVVDGDVMYSGDFTKDEMLKHFVREA